MQGVVVKNAGNQYIVETSSGDLVTCSIKGNFRIKGIKTTNPVAIGDLVVFDLNEGQPMGLIKQIAERKNCIIRKSVNLSKQTHIIAANMDQALLVVSLYQPRTPLGFIDRFLVAAESFFIPTVIIFNKIDIYDEESRGLHSEIKRMYRHIGYQCLDTSAIRQDGIPELTCLMKDKTSLLSGNSGVGKSALVNAVDSALEIRVGEVSNFHQKGKHTTTFAEMHRLSFGGYLIDTPGIKEFGMVDFKKEEISLFFPEMKSLINQCKFNNCTHEHEPGCAVKEAVEQGHIHPWRYKSYLNILHGKEMDIAPWELK